LCVISDASEQVRAASEWHRERPSAVVEERRPHETSDETEPRLTKSAGNTIEVW
jgi:hypothetical protein